MYGRTTRAKIIISTGRDRGLAEWINNVLRFTSLKRKRRIIAVGLAWGKTVIYQKTQVLQSTSI